MRQRRVGSSDLLASEVGFPVWDLVAGPRVRSDEEAAGLLRAALDLGITWFAATDHDDDGRAERLLGAAVRGRRDEVTVATSFGYDTSRGLFGSKTVPSAHRAPSLVCSFTDSRLV